MPGNTIYGLREHANLREVAHLRLIARLTRVWPLAGVLIDFGRTLDRNVNGNSSFAIRWSFVAMYRLKLTFIGRTNIVIVVERASVCVYSNVAFSCADTDHFKALSARVCAVPTKFRVSIEDFHTITALIHRHRRRDRSRALCSNCTTAHTHTHEHCQSQDLHEKIVFCYFSGHLQDIAN